RSSDLLTMNAANWEAPFGIVFVADQLSVTFVLLTAIVALAVSIFSATGVGRARMLYGYFPIFHFLIMGLNGAFLTGDIFNLYVWFRSEEHTSELQSRENLVCRVLLAKEKPVDLLQRNDRLLASKP